jgi:endonuclease VIII
MPEGDTIHRIANRLRPALVGRPLVRFAAPRATAGPGARWPVPGTTIDAVEAVGKHLLIRFTGGTTLRTHLRMSGSWHLYRTGERWRKPAGLARAVVEVEGWVAVCFAAPVVALEHDATPTALDRLGPDLTRSDLSPADVEAAAEAMAVRADPTAEIGDVLLDQRVACGVGNVFKSEVLWACGVDPFTAVGELDRATRRRLLATAAKQLRANATTSGPRTTHPAGLAVYGRAGRPCRRCGTPIRARRQGDLARTTYWCPTCQPPRPAAERG